MEAHVYLKYGAMKNLSEQQLVDCAGAFHNHGCNGGLPSQVAPWIRTRPTRDETAPERKRRESPQRAGSARPSQNETDFACA